ncbi:MAG: DUF86 domain-containing protein [Burkholderiales bacterium]|nr:DUF86 domain-containing protein [Anaerolineae bacterium]
MRDDKTYIVDIYRAARRIQDFTAGLTEEAFGKSELHQSAVIREFQVIGEAARVISQATKAAYPAIEWTRMIGLRHILVHEYFHIEYDILWKTVKNDLEPLIAQIEPLILSEHNE